jgi:hypothetical protein
MLKHNLYNQVMNLGRHAQEIISPDGVNLITNLWLSFPIIEEFHHGVKIILISGFKPCTVM